jgi:hypothetical protein
MLEHCDGDANRHNGLPLAAAVKAVHVPLIDLLSNHGAETNCNIQVALHLAAAKQEQLLLF